MGNSSKQTENTSQQTNPWAPQAGALTSAFARADDAYGKASTATAPNDFTAQFTPDQLATFRSMLGYANGNTIPGQTAATGAALSNAGTNAATGALSGLGSYDPTTLNNTGSIVDAANKYVAGQNIPDQVKNAMLSARQTARDVTLPGIEQNAAITGNTNSSRTGIADGLVERGLAEQEGALTGALNGQAFNNGITLAANNANANNADRLAALTGAAGAGTSAANSGVNANGQSINDQGNLFNLANAGGAGQQSADQANLTNLLQRYQSGVSSPYDAVNEYMRLVGSNNFGSSSTGTKQTESTPSAWQVIGGLLGGAGQAASTAGGLGWKPFA